ncbi:hypothetical protein JI723_14150 [Providencia manganoxydans]|uniref:Uncharacterized protein n=1 Tax=Providencia manganoxydans TaxID=2923283 RepID=A0ABX7ABS7_9GAMM|nr:hypothetical protein [Providencia rettgeri]QQO61405.1 hypothetical protein JI723_14150 [Providencia manganoxydans]
MEFIKDAIEVAVPLAGVVVSLVGTYVALSGLKTWKKQLKWKEDHQLAKDILINLTKYHNAINQVRSPAIFSYEKTDPPEDIKGSLSEEQIEYLKYKSVYTERLKLSSQYHNELLALGIEADAIWQNDTTKLLKKLFELEYSLVIAIRSHLLTMNPNIDKSMRDYYVGISPETDKIVYSGVDADDTFHDDFETYKSEIINMIKNKL